jgi:hypothetical protein
MRKWKVNSLAFLVLLNLIGMAITSPVPDKELDGMTQQTSQLSSTRETSDTPSVEVMERTNAVAQKAARKDAVREGGDQHHLQEDKAKQPDTHPGGGYDRRFQKKVDRSLRIAGVGLKIRPLTEPLSHRRPKMETLPRGKDPDAETRYGRPLKDNVRSDSRGDARLPRERNQPTKAQKLKLKKMKESRLLRS